MLYFEGDRNLVADILTEASRLSGRTFACVNFRTSSQDEHAAVEASDRYFQAHGYRHRDEHEEEDNEEEEEEAAGADGMIQQTRARSSTRAATAAVKGKKIKNCRCAVSQGVVLHLLSPELWFTVIEVTLSIF